jgi:hypothetical protein
MSSPWPICCLFLQKFDPLQPSCIFTFVDLVVNMHFLVDCWFPVLAEIFEDHGHFTGMPNNQHSRRAMFALFLYELLSRSIRTGSCGQAPTE